MLKFSIIKIFFFSVNDVALVIKYKFHDHNNMIETENHKKRKLPKIDSVIEYSNVKLPAMMFGQYLDNDSVTFVTDCLRYLLFVKKYIKTKSTQL